MLISIDWIKDFVKLPQIDNSELQSRFTLATAEVEGIEDTGAHLKKIMVAKIVKISKHPEADKLNLVTFNTGSDEKTVVCGAPNVKVNMIIPYAPLGTEFPGGFTLVPKKIRGILSEGMLCSESELGLSEESSGLMELPSNAPLGMSINKYLKLPTDTLLDIDNKSLTHRPDLWGHFGMAREFAAIYDLKLEDRFNKKWEDKFRKMFTKDKSPIIPQIEGECSCIGYYGLSVSNIKVKESPDWMKVRLISVGLRPINNIVDISNYVMFELGMPLHVFDRNLIKDKLVIKQVGKEIEFTTLDEEKRKLISTDTVISDSTGPLVLGGIMGGLKSGVTETTKNIFIEVANWKSASVRKTSTRLGLRTDSSQRYEKTLDSALLERTMFRTLELILELCPEAKVVGKLEYDGNDWTKTPPLKVKTSISKINTVLGIEIEEKKIIDIFTSLAFKVSKLDDDNIDVEVPSFRATKDIECLSDLIEEIGRIIGYDNIKEASPLLGIHPVSLSNAHKLHRDIKDFLVYKGNSFEIMTYPMVGEKALTKASWPVEGLGIVNALSEEHSLMRSTLLPGLLEAAAKNQKNFEAFKVFEIGRSYKQNEKEFSKESNHLAIMFFHKTENVFSELVNTTEKLLNDIKVPFIIEKKGKFKSELFLNEEWPGCHPFEYLNIRIMGKMYGAITSVHPLVLRNFKIKGNLSIAIIDLSSFESRPNKSNFKYKAIPKFPSSTFDWTVQVKKNIQVEDILAPLKKVKIKEMNLVKIVDIYSISESEKTVTLRATFNDPEKTLDGKFIDQAKDKLVGILDNAGFPLKS